jgi:hypothetical protein
MVKKTKTKTKSTKSKAAKAKAAKKGKTRASKTAKAPVATQTLAEAYGEQLDAIGRMLVGAGILTKIDVNRQGVRFALRDRLTTTAFRAEAIEPAAASISGLGAIVGGTATCVCGQSPEEHGRDAAHPGWTGCDETDCASYEADHEADDEVDDDAILAVVAGHTEATVESIHDDIEPAAESIDHADESGA